MYSNFMVGDAVIRRWNNRVYYICHDVDTSKWEFLIDRVKEQKFSLCKVCDTYTNLRYATDEEILKGYADEF